MNRAGLKECLISLVAVGMMCLTAGPAVAKGREFLGGFRDWDAFMERRSGGEKSCYMISVPKETTPKNVNRGEIYVIITHWPSEKRRNEVNVAVGYPLKKDTTVTAKVDNRSFRMFTQGDRAWAYDAKQDQDMVNAMRQGSKLVIEGESQRGTKTMDRYSLSGFTAALNAITKACF